MKQGDVILVENILYKVSNISTKSNIPWDISSISYFQLNNFESDNLFQTYSSGDLVKNYFINSSSRSLQPIVSFRATFE